MDQDRRLATADQDGYGVALWLAIKRQNGATWRVAHGPHHFRNIVGGLIFAKVSDL